MTRRRRITKSVTDKLSSTWKHVGSARKKSSKQTVSPDESSEEIATDINEKKTNNRKISEGFFLKN